MTEFVTHCLELLSPMGAARAKRMFGGHGLYLDDLFIAIVAHDTLYLKVDPSSRTTFEGAGCAPFEYKSRGKTVALGYWTAPIEALESPALMREWAQHALAAALRALQVKAAKPTRMPGTPKRRLGTVGVR